MAAMPGYHEVRILIIVAATTRRLTPTIKLGPAPSGPFLS